MLQHTLSGHLFPFQVTASLSYWPMLSPSMVKLTQIAFDFRGDASFLKGNTRLVSVASCDTSFRALKKCS